MSLAELFAVAVAVLAAVLAIAGYSIVGWIEDSHLETQEQSEVDNLAPVVLAAAKPTIAEQARTADALQRLAEQLGQHEDIRWLKVFDRQANVLAHTDPARRGARDTEPEHADFVHRVFATGKSVDDLSPGQNRFHRFFPIIGRDHQVVSVIAIASQAGAVSDATAAEIIKAITPLVEDNFQARAQLQVMAERFAGLALVRWVEVFDPSTTIIAHSLPERLGEHPLPEHRKLVIETLRSGEARVRRGTEMLSFIPVHVGGTAVGVVELVIDTSPMHAQAAQQRRLHGWILVSLVVMVGIVMLLLVRRLVVRPLQDLDRRVSEGPWANKPLPVEGYGELQALTQSVADLFSSIRETTFSRDDIIGSIQDALFLVDEDRRITLANPSASQLLAVPGEELVGSKLDDYISQLDEGEARVIRGDIAVYVRSSPLSKETDAQVFLIRDIRVQKSVEKDLEDAAEQRQRLLHEVNHRTGNNLAALLSLIEHELGSISEDQARSPLARLSSRVRGLAVVHEMLSRAEWQPIALTSLCERIVQTACQGTDPTPVVTVQQSELVVTNQQAPQIALVLAELTTNTLKYGISSDGNVGIRIEFAQEDGRTSITYRDSGPGFPPAVLDGALSEHSLGLGLIQGIVCHTLRGELRLSNDKGALITIVLGADSRVA